MSARDHVLLTNTERAALFGIPVDPDELVRRYTLEATDLDLINQRRHDRNRLGLALQVALFRHPGMPCHSRRCCRSTLYAYVDANGQPRERASELLGKRRVRSKIAA